MKIIITILTQEYERAVIFRLGLLLSGGARGPGVLLLIIIVIIFNFHRHFHHHHHCHHHRHHHRYRLGVFCQHHRHHHRYRLGVFCHSLRRCVREDRHENSNIQCAPTRGW